MAMQADHFDVAIVGAGPAGITAALHLIETGFPGRIALIEAGRRYTKRPCPADKGKPCRGCGGICNVIAGFGGSVHFGDAVKLSKFPSGRRLMEQLGEERAKQLADLALNYLFPDITANVVRPPKDFRGFALKTYPLMSVGEDAVSEMVARTYERLAKHERTSILFNTEVLEVTPTEGSFRLAARSRADGAISLSAEKVIVAVGRKGQAWWRKEIRRLALEHSPPTSSVGVRFECPSQMLRDVALVHPDFKTTVTQSDVKVKTFCFCAGQNGGRIKFTDYGSHTLLDGHVVVDRPVPTSNFALMAQLRDQQGVARSSEWIEDNIIVPYRTLREDRPGKPVIQWYPDFKEKRISCTSMQQLEATTGVAPSLRDYGVANIGGMLPPEIHEALCATFESLVCAFHCETSDTKVREMLTTVAVIGLEMEGLWDEVLVDATMQTTIPGLFACGDCSGHAQGILQSAAAGLAAADACSAILAPAAYNQPPRSLETQYGVSLPATTYL